jgi:hypothetical protein
MIARYAIGVVALIASAPALAAPLDAAAAQRFVLGKLFAFTCFDGSRGAGRVYGDGSVMGTVQLRGAGSIYSVWLPAGTLKVKGETVCASLSGIPFEPCFDLNRTDDQGFRGSVSAGEGLDAALSRRIVKFHKKILVHVGHDDAQAWKVLILNDEAAPDDPIAPTVPLGFRDTGL